MSLRYVVLLNVLVGIVWLSLQEAPSTTDFIIGYVVGFVLLAILFRGYGRRVGAVAAFTVFLVWSIVKSSVQVAGYVLSLDPALDQGIIAIPLEVQTDLEIATLATAITLTPGTLSVDVGTDASGARVLWVHNLVLGDADETRRQIKEEFEQRILRITREGYNVGS